MWKKHIQDAGLRYGSPKNLKFLIEQNFVQLGDDVFKSALDQAHRYGVPRFVTATLRSKVCRPFNTTETEAVTTVG